MTSMLTFILVIEKITDKSDITPPMIVQSQGILIFGFDVSGQVIEYQGMTFIPQKDTMGMSSELK